MDDIARGTLAALSYLLQSAIYNSQSALRNPQSAICNSQSANSCFEIINLGSDQPVVLMDAIRLVEELVGRKATLEYRPRHPADVPATWADIRKAERLLGWRPQTRFEAGLAALVEWYGENRHWARKVQTR